VGASQSLQWRYGEKNRSPKPRKQRKDVQDADLVPSKISTIVLGGTAALHTVGVGGGNFLITKSVAFGSPYHSRPNGSTSEIRSTPRLSLRTDFVNVHDANYRRARRFAFIFRFS